MKPALKNFLRRWLVNTIAVLVALKLVTGLQCPNTTDLIIATLILGILNAFVRPLLMLLSLPLLIFTLGLFTLVINALLLYFVGLLMQPHFTVRDFSSAFWGALVISIVSMVINTLTGSGSARIHVQHRRPPQPKSPDKDDDSDGPVIDV